MGGCATKPTVTNDAAGAPPPAPEKEVVPVDMAAVKEDVAEDEINKRRSLSNLFKENEEKSIEYEENKTSETEQEPQLPKPNPKETEKPKSAEEQTPAPAIKVPVLETSAEEKTEDVKPETKDKKNDEIPEVKIEEEQDDNAQKSEIPVEKIDAQEIEKPQEKKTEEAPPTPQIE